MKAAFDLVSAKHVTNKQIIGKWKLYQEVVVRANIILDCPATIEFLRNGTAITKFNGKTYSSTYTFKENKWPKSCRIEFFAHAFQGPGDAEPRYLFYKVMNLYVKHL
jgi:hypothetical protein